MNEAIAGYKLLVSYDVKESTLQEYHQFVMGRFIPVMQSMGFQIRQAWHTAYGNAPNRLLEFVCADRDTLVELLTSARWEDLNAQMEQYVTELQCKTVPYRDHFQI
jgi:hypothetical protein